MLDLFTIMLIVGRLAIFNQNEVKLKSPWPYYPSSVRVSCQVNQICGVLSCFYLYFFLGQAGGHYRAHNIAKPHAREYLLQLRVGSKLTCYASGIMTV